MNPSQKPEDSRPKPEAVSSTEGRQELNQPSGIRVLDRNTSAPLGLRIERVTPAELEEICDRFDLPLSGPCIEHIVEVLYRRAELDTGLLEREKGQGIMVGANYNRDFKAGGKKFFEERNLTLCAGSEGACPPFVMFKLERGAPDKDGANLRLELEWDLDLMDQYGFDRSRWDPASEVVGALGEAEVPETFIAAGEVVDKGPIEHAVSDRVTLEVISYESQELTGEEVERLLAEEEKIAEGDFEIVPGSIHFRSPDKSQQAEILKLAGVADFGKLADGGLLSDAMQATSSGELQDEDNLWELNTLPQNITIRAKTIFAFGNPEFAYDEADARYEEREDDEGPEADGEEDEYGAGEPDFGAASEPAGSADGLSAQEYYIMGLPTNPPGGEITLHYSNLLTSAPDGPREHFLSLDWDKDTICKQSTPGEMWEKVKAASKFMSGIDFSKAMERYTSTQTADNELTYNFPDFALSLFIVPRDEPTQD